MKNVIVVNRPYKRIMLPNANTSYIEDNRYSNNLEIQKRVVNILEKQAVSIFNFIEPTNKNMKTYSLELYQLFLSICTEFESMCKGILEDNIYNKNSDQLKIYDYAKINKIMLLSEYKCDSPIIKDTTYSPYKEWKNSTNLSWYTDYNKVKHNRETEFKRANLKNVITALAALRILLFAQYGNASLSGPILEGSIKMKIDDEYDFIFENNTIFNIRKPKKSKFDYNYNFEWDLIKNDNLDFDKFDFN